MTYWHRAARLLRAYMIELKEAESALSTEVLQEGASARHWKCVADDTRDALADARAYINALEADREADRIAAYKRGLMHGRAAQGTPANGEHTTPEDTTLPAIDPASPGLCMRWFRTRSDALAYAANAGFRQTPERRRVWLDLAWREEWSLRVPGPTSGMEVLA